MYTFNEFRARIPIQEIARSLGYWQIFVDQTDGF